MQLQEMAAGLAGLGGVKRFSKDTLFKLAFHDFYARCARNPVDENKVLFVEYRLDHPSDNFRPIMHALKKNRPELKLHFHALERGTVSEVEFIRRCRTMLKDMATAKVVFLCDANEIVSCVDKRPQTKVVQLWHACGAFKKFGLSTVGNKYGPDGEGMRAHPYYRNVDLVPVSSEEVIPCYQEAMGIKKAGVVRPIGVSRTDVFFDEEFKIRSAHRLHRHFPQTEGKKLILYAPTFRGKPSAAKAPDGLDVSALQRALSSPDPDLPEKTIAEQVVLLIKHHPFVSHRPLLPPQLADTFAIDVTEDMEIEELLAVSDLCITDYSSLVFEYSLMNRPMLFFAYDLENYNDWRGFYYPYEEMTPGNVVYTTKELAEQIKEVMAADHRGQTPWAEQVALFRERFMSACDGRATQRVLKEVFEGQDR